MEVKLNKTIKWKGKFVKAGDPIDATKAEIGEFKKNGLTGNEKEFVSNEAKFTELTAKVATLEKENEQLKADLEKATKK